MKKRIIIISILLLSCLLFTECQRGYNSYKTFILTEGTVHFSIEYRTYYKINEVHPGDNTGTVLKDIMYLTLISPKIKETGDYTYIDIIAEKPNELVPDAKSGIERAKRLAASWADYELLSEEEITIDGVKAYRIDYQNQNIIPAIAGTGGPVLSVYREVRFDANGLVWMIQMMSDSSTAEVDKSDFEYILETFEILD